MGVFRFELKQYKTSIIIWALSLSLAIIFLLPIFSGMLPEDKSSVMHSLQDNGSGVMCDIHDSHCILHWWICSNVHRNRRWL